MIRVEKINIKFRKKDVLKDISFLLKKGKCYGLLGNNGVGKTTLTKIIFNELKPSTGKVFVKEKELKEVDYKNWYFFVENNELPVNLTVLTYIEIVANIYNIKKDIIAKKISSFKEIMNIYELKNTLIKKISAGQKKMLSLFIMFMVEPKVIFFDEPTANLDIKNKEIILNFIKQYISPETIIVIITHLIEEVSSLINHVIILDEGIIKYNEPFNSTKENIKEIFKNNTLDTSKILNKIIEVNKTNE